MPLDLIVDSIDSVPEAIRGEYVEKDGKFHLNVNGIEDTTGLKSALKKERDAAATATKQAKDLAAKVAKWESLGKSEDEITKLLEKTAEAETEAAKKAGNFDALLEGHKKRSEDEKRLLSEKFNTDKSALENELNAARASERSAIIENRVSTALVGEKATKEGLDLLTERLGRRLLIETVDGKREIQIVEADGKTPMAGTGANGTATIDDLVKEAKKTWPSLFEGTGAGGSGTDPRGNRRQDTGGKVMARSAFDKLSSVDRSKRMREGWTLTEG